MDRYMDSADKLPDMVRIVFDECGFPQGSTHFVAGVSGGVDSMVLLHLLAVEMKYQVTAAHVNYKKRGKDSDADEKLVRTYCEKHDIPLEILDAGNTRTSFSGESASGNFQERAREIRREFLQSVMNSRNARAILLAHHRDDQIETIVQKLYRGAAMEHWVGMRHMDMPWVRPLLDIPKEELISYARNNRVPFRTDFSNLSSAYARNKLRNEDFPRMDQYFPGWQQNILRLSEQGEIHRALLDHVTHEVTDDARLNRIRWLNLPEHLRLPVARHWIGKKAGHINWSRGSISRLSDLVHLETGSKVPVNDQWMIVRDRARFNLVKKESKLHPVTLQLAALPEEPDKPVIHSGFAFIRSVYRSDRASGSLQLNRDSLIKDKKKGSRSDSNIENIELILRPWEHGDRIQPFGMRGYQTIADHLTNRKITASQKSKALVLETKDGTIHAVLFPHELKNGEIGTIADHARCKSDGWQILLIQKN